ncbi:MAG: FAD-dependent oxidoreductase [Chloroflexi bacterium]|nr:FAD-dependent oxidoreductase [Chloroflexota bacterium]
MNRESETFDVIIIGGGVIGCAIAARLATSNRRTVLLEQDTSLGRHASRHTSGILHSGIDLPPDTLASQMCLEGASQVHDYCHRKGIRHHRSGKLIVAQSEKEVRQLEIFARVADLRGLQNVRLLSGSEIKDVEPNVRGLAGLHIPHETVVDPIALVKSLAEDARDGGVDIRTGVTVLNVEESDQGVQVETTAGTLRGRFLVNAAGISALRLAHQCEVAQDASLLPLQAVYYQVEAELVNGVVHPVPDPRGPFVGVHIDRLADGKVRIGPRAHSAGWRLLRHRAIYRFALSPRYWAMAYNQFLGSVTLSAFASRVQQLVPEVRADELIHPQVAVRPQLVSRGKLVNDFVIANGQRSIHLLNIVSPGFTCCLTIAGRVTERIGTLS